MATHTYTAFVVNENSIYDKYIPSYSHNDEYQRI